MHYLEGNYTPLSENKNESDMALLEGAFPERFPEGMFIRGGPNPPYTPQKPYTWFDGDAMLHFARLTKQKTTHSCRFVRTSRLEHEREHKTADLFMTLAMLKGPGAFLAGRRQQKLEKQGQIDTSCKVPNGGLGTANTALVFHAGKLLALNEGDAPHSISLTDGESGDEWHDFAHKLPGPFTAHPKVDPDTNELLGFGYTGSEPYVTVYNIDKNGEMNRKVPLTKKEIGRPKMIHDMWVTENFFVIPDTSLAISMQRMLIPGQRAFYFDNKQRARIGLLPRNEAGRRMVRTDTQDQVRWFNLPAPAMIFHTIAAWEDEDRKGMTLYACKLDDFDMAYVEEKGGEAPPDNQRPRPFRFKIDFDRDEASWAKVLPHRISADFPVINASRVTKRANFAYMSIQGPVVSKFTGMVKVDIAGYEDGYAQNAIAATANFGNNVYGQECVFVSAENAVDEDDGFLVAYLRDELNEKSLLAIYEAKKLKRVALYETPVRVPYGFHGAFVRMDELSVTV